MELEILVGVSTQHLGPGPRLTYFLFGDGLGVSKSGSVGLTTHYLTFLEQKEHLAKSTVPWGNIWKAVP